MLEVGLGGRLDATNLLAADVAVLASVGFDHRDYLGDTLELIGAEKAGIFRPQRPAVLGTRAMPESVYAAIEACGARAVIAERDFRWRVRAGRWDYQGLTVTLRGAAALGARRGDPVPQCRHRARRGGVRSGRACRRARRWRARGRHSRP